MKEQPMAVDSPLDTLEAKGLIKLAAHSPELEYLFRQWLVQDAAYGSLLKQERRELHRLVGESLESLYPERKAELAGVLAIHFEQAGDSERAVEYLAMQGQYALERNAIREAYAAFDRAIGLLPPAAAGDDAAVKRRRLEIELGRLRASWTMRAADEVLEEFEALLPVADDLGDLELVSLIHTYLALMLLERGTPASDPRIQRSLGRLAEVGRELDDPSLGALPLALIGLNQTFVGPIREGVAALEEAVPMMVRRRDQIGAAFARGALAVGYAELGLFEKADEAVVQATEMAREGDVVAQLDAQIAQALVHSLRGELDSAQPLAEDCVARGQESGATACTVMSTWVLGDIYQRQGRFDEASETLRLGASLAPVTGSNMLLSPSIQAWLGLSLVSLGAATSEDEFQSALETARAIGNRIGQAGILWKRAQARARQQRFDEAWPDFEASAAVWEEEGARPTLARVLASWGQALRTAGREDQGVSRLRRALELFDELGITSDAQAARLALAGPGPIKLG
jgi:tetratricopeptide (TPR) repeat protein